MSPRTEEQNKEIREKRKQEILSAAMRLFAENGYHTTSIDKIAKEVKVSKGLIYNYFSSKEELLRGIIEEGVSERWQYFDPDHDGYLTKDELHFFVEMTFKSLKDHLEFWQFYFTVLLKPDLRDIVLKETAHITEPISDTFIEYFKRQKAEDPKMEMIFFNSLIRGIILQYISAPDRFPLEKIEKKILKLYNL